MKNLAITKVKKTNFSSFCCCENSEMDSCAFKSNNIS